MSEPHFNPALIDDNCCLVPLGRGGRFALIDKTDWDLVAPFPWFAQRSRNTRYAKYTRRIRLGGGKCRFEHGTMHRIIMGVTDPKITVDHRNRNGLDNRRGNLRIATQVQNVANAAPPNGRRFKGVWLSYGAYVAVIRSRKEDRRLHLGRFSTEEDAARAYDMAALAIHGEFARLNFPDEARLIAEERLEECRRLWTAERRRRVKGRLKGRAERADVRRTLLREALSISDASWFRDFCKPHMRTPAASEWCETAAVALERGFARVARECAARAFGVRL